MSDQQKVLITGSAGFIGHHLAMAMADQGYEVVGLDNINDYYDTGLKYGRLKEQGIEGDELPFGEMQQGHAVRFIRMELEDKEGLHRLFKEEQFQRVIHLAAQAGVRYSVTHPQKYVDSNITGFLNILECSQQYGIEHLIFASSSSVYGLQQEIPFRESNATSHPVSMYAATKKSNELMAHVFSSLYNLPVTGLRFFTVYGPWARPDMALHLFTSAIFEERPIRLFNEGNMERDFTYVDDIVKGVIAVSEKLPTPAPEDAITPDRSPVAPYRMFNIGNNKPTRLLDYVEAIEKATGKTAEKVLEPMQPGDMERTFASAEQLIDHVGFKPETDLQYGVDQFVAWYRNYYNV